MNNLLTFRQFTRPDFEEYNSWFSNKPIRKALENIDEEWLDYILQDKSGIEYAILSASKLIAVLGISLPTEKDPYYAITNIAINPKHFRKGIGTKTLQELYNIHTLKPGEAWITFVDKWNTAAQRFFEKNHWKYIRLEEENLMRYEYAYI